MKLQKFGIKLYIDSKSDYSTKDYIPIFHKWIQNKVIDNHVLIDVADYSHIIDGPGVMLIAHEGYFSLDQENNKPSIMYMRKTSLTGNFIDRFCNILNITIEAAKRLEENNLKIIKNCFRFISNDRLYAENTTKNQDYYKSEIEKALSVKYLNCQMDYGDFSSNNERLAFTIKFRDATNIFDI